MLTCRYRARPGIGSDFGNGFYVRGRRTAASPDKIQPAMLDKLVQLRGQTFWSFIELHLLVGQSGVRVAGNPGVRHLVERPQMIGHEIRARSAIQTYRERLGMSNGGPERIDALARKHSACGLNRSRKHERDASPHLLA